MLSERTNLRKELEKLSQKAAREEDLLKEVKNILHAEKKTEEEILQRLEQTDYDVADRNAFDFDQLESKNIFHVEQIKKICVAYRLRFLPTKFFKGRLPEEAIAALQNLEYEHQTELKGFRMIAPAGYFRLENADDPMLFAPIGNDYYYLIHKWGKDIHPLRKLMVWPLKNMEQLIMFCLGLSFFLTFIIREIFFSRFQETSEFLILFMYTFKSVIALIFFYGISLGKNFSSGNWNSKFYNA